MRTLLSIAVLMLAVIAGLLAFEIFHRQSEQWSYTIIAPSDSDFIEELNKLGASGWEIVSARRASLVPSIDIMSYEVIMKRHGVAPVVVAKSK